MVKQTAVDPQALHIAKQAAKLFTTQMAALTAIHQLMTIELIAKAIFINDVKPEKRLELFDQWSADIRNEIKSSTKKRKPDATT